MHGVSSASLLLGLLTGLRFSGDMVSPTWSEVGGESAEGWYLKFNVKKNGRLAHLPLEMRF